MIRLNKRLILIRNFSTARALRRPALSAEYKSEDLWNNRFNCKILGGDMDLIKSVNHKIMTASELNNLEVDIFLNIASPSTVEIAQLREVVNILKTFRKTLYAHKMLPSTHHAACRLFLDSKRVPSLISLLEDRITYGVFPDSFSLNLLFDKTLEQGDLAMASRVASLIMIQEEFGANKISDTFAIYSVAKYIESKTDFSDWNQHDVQADPVFLSEEEQNQQIVGQKKQEEAGAEDGEEDEDDAEYIRVPWLKNPYFDNHFDLKNPRLICGKTLSLAGLHMTEANEDAGLATKCLLLGSVLQGEWTKAMDSINKCVQSKISTGNLSEISKFYIDNLHDVPGPDDDLKSQLISGLDGLSSEGPSISEAVETKFKSLGEQQLQDIEWMKTIVESWSEKRLADKEAKSAMEERKKLIEEIQRKKEELRLKEQFLYFYDNLKKNSLTRLSYD